MLEVQVLSLRPLGACIFCGKYGRFSRCKKRKAPYGRDQSSALVLSADNTGIFYVVKNAKRFTGETSLPVCPSGLPAGIYGACIFCGKYGRFSRCSNAKRLTGETSLPVYPSGLPAGIWRLCFLRKIQHLGDRYIKLLRSS